jgi:hypothetical protein
MKQSLFFIIFTITLACGNKPSLQKYMVENSEKKEFTFHFQGKNLKNLK